MSVPVPNPQDQKKKEFERIAESRKEILDAEKQRRTEREEALKQSQEIGAAAFHEEVAEARERYEEGLELREKRHQEKIEVEQWKKKKEEEQARLIAQQKKNEKLEEEKKAYLADLHHTAVLKKVKAKKETMKREEDQSIKATEDSRDRSVHALDEETQRKLHAIDNDTRRKITDAQSHAVRRTQEIEERARLERSRISHAAPAMEAAQTKMRIESERKRSIMSVEEQTNEQTVAINMESKRLKDEALREEQARKAHLQSQAERKKREAQHRRRSAEEWLDGGG